MPLFLLKVLLLSVTVIVLSCFYIYFSIKKKKKCFSRVAVEVINVTLENIRCLHFFTKLATAIFRIILHRHDISKNVILYEIIWYMKLFLPAVRQKNK